jgi:hypothetical protein
MGKNAMKTTKLINTLKTTAAALLSLVFVGGGKSDVVSGNVTQLSSPAEISPGGSTVDFEGLGNLTRLVGTDLLPGLSFCCIGTFFTVADPARINNSPNLPAATSGTAAVATPGSPQDRIGFSHPVNEVAVFVSFVSINAAAPDRFAIDPDWRTRHAGEFQWRRWPSSLRIHAPSQTSKGHVATEAPRCHRARLGECARPPARSRSCAASSHRSAPARR